MRSLHLDVFEKARIPLPPLPEQRRIVAKIERLAAKVEEAKGIRQHARESTEGLLISDRQRR
ncbi:MAG: restriction endonuclease subunit S [Deltaproteobacteria bacterium]|nr:restriction endonuclease subunit S [Deltaproteobacteria bacterium]